MASVEGRRFGKRERSLLARTQTAGAPASRKRGTDPGQRPSPWDWSIRWRIVSHRIRSAKPSVPKFPAAARTRAIQLRSAAAARVAEPLDICTRADSASMKLFWKAPGRLIITRKMIKKIRPFRKKIRHQRFGG